MKFNLKKLGQTATEYLIILAVVIVIALIIVSVMGGIPGIGKSGIDKADQAFWSTTEISIPAYANTQSSGMVIKMKNNLNEGIYIDTFSLQGVNGQMVDVFNSTSSIYIETGATVQIPLKSTPTCLSGDTYSYGVEINYTALRSYTFNGYGHKLVGKCGN